MPSMKRRGNSLFSTKLKFLNQSNLIRNLVFQMCVLSVSLLACFVRKKPWIEVDLYLFLQCAEVWSVTTCKVPDQRWKVISREWGTMKASLHQTCIFFLLSIIITWKSTNQGRENTHKSLCDGKGNHHINLTFPCEVKNMISILSVRSSEKLCRLQHTGFDIIIILLNECMSAVFKASMFNFEFC